MGSLSTGPASCCRVCSMDHVLGPGGAGLARVGPQPCLGSRGVWVTQRGGGLLRCLVIFPGVLPGGAGRAPRGWRTGWGRQGQGPASSRSSFPQEALRGQSLLGLRGAAPQSLVPPLRLVRGFRTH